MLDEEEIKPSRGLDEYWAMAKRRRWFISTSRFLLLGDCLGWKLAVAVNLPVRRLDPRRAAKGT